MDSIVAVFSWIIENWQAVLLGATSIVTGASIIAKLTPTKSDDAIVDGILAFLHKLALNPGRDSAR